jgi:hypothetical protein
MMDPMVMKGYLHVSKWANGSVVVLAVPAYTPGLEPVARTRPSLLSGVGEKLSNSKKKNRQNQKIEKILASLLKML